MNWILYTDKYLISSASEAQIEGDAQALSRIRVDYQ